MLNYDINKYRGLFPIVQTGTVYLNHAATGPLSTRVVAAVDKYLHERSETHIDNFELFQPVLNQTRLYASRLLNATPDRIAFFENTTNAINLLAAGLTWKQGDRIILDDIEFPANVYPFLNLKQLGVEIDFVANRDGKILIEDIESKITPRTRLLSISHVQFLTGFRSDLPALGEVCRSHDIIFSVDAIQSAGVIPIDVNQMKIDFLAAGGQKWLLAPQGIAFAYFSKETQDKLQQAYLGWTSIKNYFSELTKYRIDLDDTARRYENGTLNYIGITSLHESLGMLLEVGIENIKEHVLDLNDRLIKGLRDIGLRASIEGDRCQRAGIISTKVPDPEAYASRLAQSKIQVAVRQGLVRVSPHFYNTDAEIDMLLERFRSR